MSRVVEGHLVSFGSVQDFEESPEMEAPAEDFDMLSAREERIEKDYYDRCVRLVSKKRKKSSTAKRGRTR